MDQLDPVALFLFLIFILWLASAPKRKGGE